MNRTASDGHETLRSLLLHTGDPLPLVLALDELDPDDPTTQKLAAEITENTAHYLREAYHRIHTRTNEDHDNLPQRLNQQGISSTTQNYILRHHGRPPQITPATAINDVSHLLNDANRLPTPIKVTLPLSTRLHLALLLTGPPTVIVDTYSNAHFRHNPNPTSLQEITLTAPSSVQRQLQRVHKDALQNPNLTWPPEGPRYESDSLRASAYLQTTHANLASALQTLDSLIKQHIPTAIIHHTKS